MRNNSTSFSNPGETSLSMIIIKGMIQAYKPFSLKTYISSYRAILILIMNENYMCRILPWTYQLNYTIALKIHINYNNKRSNIRVKSGINKFAAQLHMLHSLRPVPDQYTCTTEKRNKTNNSNSEKLRVIKFSYLNKLLFLPSYFYDIFIIFIAFLFDEIQIFQFLWAL
eukprot:gene1265-723_t